MSSENIPSFWCECKSFISTGRKPCKVCELVDNVRNKTIADVEKIIDSFFIKRTPFGEAVYTKDNSACHYNSKQIFELKEEIKNLKEVGKK